VTDTTEPRPEHRFTFGLWTVGWQARDPFGDPTRPALDPVEAVERLAGLGAWGVTFHDDDAVPVGSDDAAREEHLKRFREALGGPAPTCSGAAARAARSTSPRTSSPRSTATGRPFEDFDADAKGERSHGATQLDQLALEHLLGAR
jgi:hypothetical protein